MRIGAKMPLLCELKNHRVDDGMEALAEIKNDKEKLKLTGYYARLLQKFVEVSQEDQRRLVKQVCTECKGICCRNTNCLHLSDVLKCWLGQAGSNFLPEFPKSAEIGTDKALENCAYLSPKGCIIHRKNRPLICVQYTCDKWDNIASEKLLELMKAVRAAMEDTVMLYKIEAGQIDGMDLSEVEERLKLFERMLNDYCTEVEK